MIPSVMLHGLCHRSPSGLACFAWVAAGSLLLACPAQADQAPPRPSADSALEDDVADPADMEDIADTHDIPDPHDTDDTADLIVPVDPSDDAAGSAPTPSAPASPHDDEDGVQPPPALPVPGRADMPPPPPASPDPRPETTAPGHVTSGTTCLAQAGSCALGGTLGGVLGAAGGTICAVPMLYVGTILGIATTEPSGFGGIGALPQIAGTAIMCSGATIVGGTCAGIVVGALGGNHFALKAEEDRRKYDAGALDDATLQALQVGQRLGHSPSAAAAASPPPPTSMAY